MDNELLLVDRIAAIQAADKEFNLNKNAYLSFSGGKDSTILHYLIDLALPGNKIPRVFINTGIEFHMIVNFVKDLAKKDDRFIILNPTKPIKKVLEENGYPFKSKQHSRNVAVYQHSGMTNTNIKYLGLKNTPSLCPKCLRYQFSPEFRLKISDNCCLKMKKEPIHNWAKENNKSISITGMRKDEYGYRRYYPNCAVYNGNTLVKFHPLKPISNDFEEWFINTISNFVTYIIHHLTLAGLAVKDVHLLLIYNIVWMLWRNYYPMKSYSVKLFGSQSMMNIED